MCQVYGMYEYNRVFRWIINLCNLRKLHINYGTKVFNSFFYLLIYERIFWMSAFVEKVFGVKLTRTFAIIEAVPQRVILVTECFVDVMISISSG